MAADGARPAGGPWFAHSLDGRPEAEWEPLERHLRETEQGAAARAAKFGAAELGTAAGRLHDLGKYKPEFLARIRKQSDAKVDHASAGANHARALGVPGRLLAHAIAGHRTGLADELFARGDRLDRTP